MGLHIFEILGVRKSWQVRIHNRKIHGKKVVTVLLDKLETTPLRVVISYAYLVFSQPPACLQQAM